MHNFMEHLKIVDLELHVYYMVEYNIIIHNLDTNILTCLTFIIMKC